MLRGKISTIPHRKREMIIGNITSTFTVSRGHLRGFVEQSINHQIRWPWRVIDVSLNREVAAGVEITRVVDGHVSTFVAPLDYPVRAGDTITVGSSGL